MAGVLHLPWQPLIYQCPKWIPNMIPMEGIHKIAKGFEQIPRLKAWGKNYGWDKFMVARNQTLFWVSFYLALRPKEAVCLKFEDIFKTPDGIYIIKIRGSSNKLRKERILSVPSELSPIINSYLTQFSFKRFWGQEGYLFPSYMNRDHHISRYQWNDLFQAALRQAGYWRKHPTKPRGLYTAYSLRHSRAVDMLENENMQVSDVANILGHASICVTQSYLPICPTTQKRMYAVLSHSQIKHPKIISCSS